MYTKIKTATEIESMRESGAMLAAVLRHVEPLAVPGVTVKELADAAAAELKSLGGEAPFKGYGGPPRFPDVICISLNDEVVHGIPTERVVQDGDLVSLDFGVRYRGMITDSAMTLIAGKARQPRHAELVDATEQSMYAGISVLRDGVRIGDIGAAVEAVLKRGKFGIVRDLVGHGVGHELHEDPNIPNYGQPGRGAELHAGMTIAIEPMATLGGERVYVAADDWTIKTWDGSLAAHFEHTILLTEDGFEVLTERNGVSHKGTHGA
jgi:methionyl aminopeptidase